MIIGHFEFLDQFETDDYVDSNGCYVGHIHSLWFNHHRVVFEPVRDKHGNGPDFRITSLPSVGGGAACTIGDAWDREQLSRRVSRRPRTSWPDLRDADGRR